MRGTRQMLYSGALVALAAGAGRAQFTFTSADYATPPEPKGLAVGDFDGNGTIDAATTASDQINILLNAGDGALESAVSYPVGGVGAGHLIGAMFDGDKDLDLALVLSDDNRVRVMRNAGDGTFVQGALLNVGAQPTWMIGFDADGDKDVDLAVVNTGAASVTVLFNNGDAGFPESKTFPVGGDPRAAAAADFDGDGDADIAVTSYTDRTVSIFLNDGTGGFTFAQAVIAGGQVGPDGIVAADLDDDGDTDLAATTWIEGGSNLMAVFKNSGGTFGAPTHFPIGAIEPGAVIAADFNGDGNLDLAAVAHLSRAVSLLQGNGDGSFGAAELVGVGDNPRRLRSGDFNGDDKVDVAVTNRDSNTVTVLTNTGAQGGCLADLDGNGTLDLFDFLNFQNLFNAQDPKADCEENGAFDLFDFLCYQNLFVQGCP